MTRGLIWFELRIIMHFEEQPDPRLVISNSWRRLLTRSGTADISPSMVQMSWCLRHVLHPSSEYCPRSPRRTV